MATVNANAGGSLSAISYAADGAGTNATPVVGNFGDAVLRLKKVGGGQVVAGSVRFTFAGSSYSERLGRVLTNLDVATGAAADVGAANYASGDFTITSRPNNAAQGVVVQSGLVQTSSSQSSSITFRTPAAPLRPGTLSIAGTKVNGSAFTGSFGTNGFMVTADAVGVCDFQTGVARVWFRKATGNTQDSLDLSSYAIPGVTTIYFDPVYAETLRFNATAYSYLPLDASLLGVNPVRLPSDGRVPTLRPGDLAVVGHTKSASATVSNGQVFSAGRVRLSRVRVLDSTGVAINTGYTADLEAGTVTFANVSSYNQPITIEDRVEDLVQLSDVQINGRINFNRQLTHTYPVPGSYVSGALVAGDLFARASLVFDQGTWNGQWKDAIEGSPATGTYNTTLAPIEVTNIGAIAERWVIRFTNTTAFEVIGENVGVIATGNISSDLAPINPAVGHPYFTIRASGWGSGWSVGNVLRINTVGAMFPIQIVETIQAGPETGTNHDFTLLIRGDVDTP
ncbi:MAG: hypothetical protein HEQ39_09735 [Rhizobacter sp.]